MVILRKAKAPKEPPTPLRKSKRLQRNEDVSEDLENVVVEETKKEVMMSAKKKKRMSQKLEELEVAEDDIKPNENTKKELVMSAKKKKRLSQKLVEQEVADEEIQLKETKDVKKELVMSAKKKKRLSQKLVEQQVADEEIQLEETEDVKKTIMTPGKKKKRKSQMLEELKAAEEEVVHQEDTNDTKVPVERRKSASISDVENHNGDDVREESQEYDINDDITKDAPVQVEKPKKKRKIPPTADSSAKKAKPSGITTCVFSNMPAKAKPGPFRHFLSEKDLKNVEFRFASSRRAFVDVSSDHVDRALSLNDTKWLGSQIKVALDDLVKQKKPYFDVSSDCDRRSIHCGNIPYDASEEEIAELFDGVKEVRIPRKAINDESRGFAFVEFETEELREAALEKKHGVILNKRHLLITAVGTRAKNKTHEPKQLKPSKKHDKLENKVTNPKRLFVVGLTRDVDESVVLETFKGAISVEIPTYKHGKKKVFAFVDFDTAEDAQSAYDESSKGLEINGRPVRVDFAVYEPQLMSDTKILFVKGVTEDMEESSLLKCFDNSTGATITLDIKTGKNKPFAYVEFDSAKEAKKAYETFENGFEIDGNLLKVTYSKVKHVSGLKGLKSKLLMLKDVPQFMQKYTVLLAFPGATNAAIIPIERDSDKTETFGFVEFETEKAAETAYKKNINGVEIDGKQITVSLVQKKRDENKKETKNLSLLGVADDTTKSDVKKIFKGAIEVAFKRNKVTGRKAIVEFKTMKDALNAHRKSKSGVEINGTKVQVMIGTGKQAGKHM